MAATNATNDRLCIYCGGKARRVRKGEHIVPKAIDGALTIAETSGRLVCQDCNNGVLSELDKELCSRSFLSIVASQEIGAHLWQVWEVDHSSGNVLIEAKPFWQEGELRSLVCYPQITFEADRPEIRGDSEEIKRFGRDEFAKVLVTAARRAYQRYNRNEKALHFELIESDITSQGYRFPPRVFTSRSIGEIARNVWKQQFVLRFDSEEGRRVALRGLSRLVDSQPFNRWGENWGARLPTIAHLFNMGSTVRALTKLGINLLAAYCQKTPVNRDTFRQAVRLIRGTDHPGPGFLAANGFVHAENIEQIRADGQSHAFRLVYLYPNWLIYLSFFGGRIGAVVSFPGPNREEWNTLDIVAPLKSKKWRSKCSSLIQPIKVQVDWNDVRKIAPSVRSQHSVSRIYVERVPAKRR